MPAGADAVQPMTRDAAVTGGGASSEERTIASEFTLIGLPLPLTSGLRPITRPQYQTGPHWAAVVRLVLIYISIHHVNGSTEQQTNLSMAII